MPTQADRVQSPSIKVDGTELAPTEYYALEHLAVERSLWMPSRCSLRFVDNDFEMVDGSKFAVGKALDISLPDPSGSIETVFKGEVTDIAFDQYEDMRNEFVVGALDKSHRLSTLTKYRTFAKMTYSDVVRQIAGEAGLSAQVESTTPAHDYLIQTTTDYEFLWDIARRIGFAWWVDDGALHFAAANPNDGPTLTYGVNLLEFRVRYSGGVKADTLTVQGWDTSSHNMVTGDDAQEMNGSGMPKLGSTAPIATEGRSNAVKSWGKGKLTTGVFMAPTATEAKEVAAGLAQQVDAAEVVARGHALTTPKLKPGGKVTIAKMGTKVSGDYFVTSVEHSWGPEPGVRTRFTAGNKQPIGLADLIGATATTTPTWGTQGLVAGVVTANKDDPDSIGRVQVKFGSFSDADTSAWARVMTFDAGPERGAQFMPEVGDEVILGFEQGDLRYPVVLGSVWSKKNKPPQAAATNPVELRTIKTRVGHVIEIADGSADNKKYVSITLADGTTKLNLAHDKVELIANSKPLTIKSGQASMEFDASGNITIKGQKVTIEATQDLAAKGMNVKVNGNANVELAANAQFKASGNAGANLETSAIAIVKGSMVKIN